MTYTFDPALANDVSLVRFHIGDNHSEGHFLEDETIKYFVDTTTVESAVITCIKYIISQLSQPDFVQDWLEVKNKDAREGYQALLKEKQKEFGLGTSIASVSISLPTRADSYQTDNDYSEVVDEDVI